MTRPTRLLLATRAIPAARIAASQTRRVATAATAEVQSPGGTFLRARISRPRTVEHTHRRLAHPARLAATSLGRQLSTELMDSQGLTASIPSELTEPTVARAEMPMPPMEVMGAQAGAGARIRMARLVAREAGVGRALGPLVEREGTAGLPTSTPIVAVRVEARVETPATAVAVLVGPEGRVATEATAVRLRAELGLEAGPELPSKAGKELSG